MEIGHVQCFLGHFFSLASKLLFCKKTWWLCSHCAARDPTQGSLPYMIPAWGFADPKTEATAFAGAHQRASASGSLTGPHQKLLLAVFQLSAFIVVCLADLWAITCHGFRVMCAAAACPEGFYFVFLAGTISVLLLWVGGRCTIGQSQRGALCADCYLLCLVGKLPGWSRHQFFCRGTGEKEALVCPKLL